VTGWPDETGPGNVEAPINRVEDTMAKTPAAKAGPAVCGVCGRSKPRSQLKSVALIRLPIAELIRNDHPDLSADGFVCHEDLNRYRSAYVESLVAAERGEISNLEREVVDSLARHDTLSSNVEEEFQQQLTLGQRTADRVAGFGGSWPFIILFGVIIIVWMAVNSLILVRGAFDPYPYILLNLVLSCLAALQAPVIMMSQNRQEARDRLHAESDYQVNLKAELEIRQIHEKLDFMLQRQWERLMEIQQIQIELMHEMTRRGR
jgi:uncharacterized membrane protein